MSAVPEQSSLLEMPLAAEAWPDEDRRVAERKAPGALREASELRGGERIRLEYSVDPLCAVGPLSIGTVELVEGARIEVLFDQGLRETIVDGRDHWCVVGEGERR